jgi:GNAT superfamily N-acetyltransferase
MNAEIEIVRLPESQIQRAGEVMARAFFNDPLIVYMFPDVAQRARLLPLHFTPFIHYVHLFGEAFATGGDLQGVAVWLPPGELELRPEGMQQTRLDQAAELIGREALQRYLTMEKHIEPYHQTEVAARHWFLPLLAVDTPLQGKGIGGALLKPILNRADAEGLPAYLWTVQPKNPPFYQRHGFVVATEGVEPKSGIRFWTMRRDPQT